MVHKTPEKLHLRISPKEAPQLFFCFDIFIPTHLCSNIYGFHKSNKPTHTGNEEKNWKGIINAFMNRENYDIAE